MAIYNNDRDPNEVMWERQNQKPIQFRNVERGRKYTTTDLFIALDRTCATVMYKVGRTFVVEAIHNYGTYVVLEFEGGDSLYGGLEDYCSFI